MPHPDPYFPCDPSPKLSTHFVCGAGGGRERQPNVEGMRGIISAVVASLAGSDVAEGTPLSQAGLDSLAFVELRNELTRCTSLSGSKP
jgi:hypothetical protein